MPIVGALTDPEISRGELTETLVTGLPEEAEVTRPKASTEIAAKL
jgi:hypothetical protein